MGMLATCPKCQCTYMPGNPCPNCEAKAGSSGEMTEVMKEYAQRQEAHTMAYAAFMGRGMAGGLVGLLGAIAMTFLMFCGGLPMWFVVVAAILILIAGGVAAASQMYLVQNKGALEIHCPACDVRVDEMPMEGGFCPGCNVRLR